MTSNRFPISLKHKMPKNVGDLGKSIAAKGFKNLPKVQKWPNLVTLFPISLKHKIPRLLKA